MASWIAYNSIMVDKENFDPYPFILLNLILSCIAALQAPIIMMSQNRKEENDRRRSENSLYQPLLNYMQSMKPLLLKKI